jgi:serine/threonine protein kinase
MKMARSSLALREQAETTVDLKTPFPTEARPAAASEGAIRDFFVSYTSADRTWAEWIAWELEEAGYSVWLQVWDFRGSFPEDMSRAHARSRHTLVVLSDRYLESTFAASEGWARYAQDPARLVPVKVGPVNDASILLQFQYADLTGSDEVEARRRLNERVKMAVNPSYRPKPQTRPGFPGDLPRQDKPTFPSVRDRPPAGGHDVDETAPSPAHVMVRDIIRADLRSAVEKILKSKNIELGDGVRSGEFSQVFLGKDLEREIDVAVKVLIKSSRLDAICGELEEALKKAMHYSQRNESLINIWSVGWETDPRYVVMDHITWPLLKRRLDDSGGRCPEPEFVARILSKVAEAQDAAHARGLPLGPLSPREVYVGDDGEIRISPFRLEALLTSRLGLADGFPFRWAALSRLPPELHEGQQPTPATYDRTGQYYLGLLGLELLRGSKPVEVRCLADLGRLRAFYRNPRKHFVNSADAADVWTKRSPALAFVVSRLLERDPAKRYANAREAANELEQIAEGRLPRSVTHEIRSGYSRVVDPAFAARFYCRLFKAENGERLKRLFSKVSGDQRVTADHQLSADHHAAFTRALRGIDSYDPEGHPPLAEVFDRHPGYRVTAADVEDFRAAFLDEIGATFREAPRQREAWGVVLHRPLLDLCSRLG